MKSAPRWIFVSAMVMGCGGASVPVAKEQTTNAARSPTRSSAAPSALECPDAPRDAEPIASEPAPVKLEELNRLSQVKGVPVPPAICTAYVSRRSKAAKDVAAAVSETDPAARDAMLVGLESKDDATLRALRADLAPIECGDAIVDPWMAGKREVRGRVGHAMVGLSLAGRLSRLPTTPPTMPAENDKSKVSAFVKGPLQAWSRQQAAALEAIESSAATLTGYGRAVSALESGAAELRFIDKLRSSPIPASWDAELKGIYEAMLDEALEARKARGRDAAACWRDHA